MTLHSHWDQSGGSVETEKSIDDRIQVIPQCSLHTTPFVGNGLYVCLNEPFT